VLFVAVLGAAVGLGAPLLAGISCVFALGVLRVLGGWQYRRQNTDSKNQLPLTHNE
jgi:hypothetical protein